MRQRFSQQQILGITPISEVAIPKNSRHELATVLAALQHIFVTPELNERVFALIGSKIKGTKQDTGRTGMDMWEKLVLATVRLADCQSGKHHGGRGSAPICLKKTKH